MKAEQLTFRQRQQRALDKLEAKRLKSRLKPTDPQKRAEALHVREMAKGNNRMSELMAVLRKPKIVIRDNS